LTIISIMIFVIATESRTAKIRQKNCNKCLILQKHENKKPIDLNVYFVPILMKQRFFTTVSNRAQASVVATRHEMYKIYS